MCVAPGDMRWIRDTDVNRDNCWIHIGLPVVHFRPPEWQAQFHRTGVRPISKAMRKSAKYAPLQFRHADRVFLSRVSEAVDRLAGACSLTTHEEEILRWVCTGKKNVTIAWELHRSLATVRLHLRNVYRKTQTSNKVDLILACGFRKF